MQAKKSTVYLTADQRGADRALRELEVLREPDGAAYVTTSTGRGATRVPAAAVEPILEVLRLIAAGSSPVVTAHDEELTTQEAADFLNISRPTLLQRLEEGAIPFRWEGSHRRVRLADVVAYKEARSKRREEAMEQLRALEEEAGLPEF